MPGARPQRLRGDDLEQQFLRQFGREPTPEEKRLWQLADAVLETVGERSAKPQKAAD